MELSEIQRCPELFPVLRVLADRRPLRARFLLLGSASPSLLRQGSESLAGRIAYYQLPGFSLPEVGAKNAARLWLRGGFPRSFLAASDAQSMQWRQAFLRGYLDKLTDALVMHQLKPWHENLAKRQVRATRLYVRDSGLLHALLNLPGQSDLEAHPQAGASREGFIDAVRH